jgi:hypothetical protein
VDTPHSPSLTLTDDDLPDLHDGANQASLRGQKVFLRATSVKLLVACAAAGISSLEVDGSQERVLTSFVGVCFLAVLVVEAFVWATKPERDWYDGRALAESTKTMAWRFAVGAAPYECADPTARTRYIEDLKKLLKDAPETGVHPSQKEPISAAMEHVRASGLDERRAIYLRDRLEDQRHWYSTKADTNRVRATQWRIFLLAFEGLAILGAFMGHVGAAGFIAAIVAAGAAWMGIRQHENNKRAYTFAALELSIAGNELKTVTDEERWTKAAADAEEAVSREHTMWRASRSSVS